MKARPAVRLDAVESYVRGLLSTSPEQRHRYFTQAARLDANYSQPCFELGRVFWEKKDYKVAGGWLERVARSDPHYLEAQFFLGLCRFANGDFKGAEQSFQLVAAAIPLNEVYNDLGVVQAQRQDYSAAAASFRAWVRVQPSGASRKFGSDCSSTPGCRMLYIVGGAGRLGSCGAESALVRAVAVRFFEGVLFFFGFAAAFFFAMRLALVFARFGDLRFTGMPLSLRMQPLWISRWRSWPVQRAR